MNSARRSCIVAIFVLGVLQAPTAVARQDRPQGQVPAPASVPEDVREQHEELLRVRGEVVELLFRVFAENPELEKRRVAFEALQEKTMAALDAETARRRARMAEIESLYNAAVASDDATGLDALRREGREIRRALDATAAEARRQPAVAKEAEAFSADLRARLVALNPDALRLITRDDQLVALLGAAMLAGR